MVDDERYMRICLEAARVAGQSGEVPIGALVVLRGSVVGRGANRTVVDTDPSAHAEVVALRAAATAVGNHRLPGAELFVTVEPCLMCVGVALQARLSRVVFGCRDEKGGFLGSLGDYSADRRLNHRFQVRAGVCAEEARVLMRDFFRVRR